MTATITEVSQAPTKEFDKLVARYEATGNLGQLYGKIYECYERARDQTDGTFHQKLEAAVFAVCREFHLEYYRGHGDTLTRVSGRP